MSLRELQESFRLAMLDRDNTAVRGCIVEDGLPVDERLAIYRNNVFASLTEVLLDTFPVVCRLVDERFFRYAAHEFVREQPPRRAHLAEYGEGFADFLAIFPPCAGLPYLPDVARLEWFMHRAANAADEAPLPLVALAKTAEADLSRLSFRFHPSIGFLASRWPAQRIWRAHQRTAELEGGIELDEEGTRIEVRRHEDEVVYRLLDAGPFVFRSRLAAGTELELAADAALAVDPVFDLSVALAALFSEGLVTALAVAPSAGPQYVGTA